MWTIQSSKSLKYVSTWVKLGVMLGSIFRDFSKFFKISKINFWSSQIVSGMSKSVPNLPNFDFKLTRSFKFDENLKISKLTQKMKRYEGCSAGSNVKKWDMFQPGNLKLHPKTWFNHQNLKFMCWHGWHLGDVGVKFSRLFEQIQNFPN